GEGMAKTMRLALENSGTSPEDIDYINAHGTSTTLNDKYETMAIREVFGSRAGSIPVSSVKSMIGHTIGAAGAIEAAITSMSVRNDMVAPTMNLERRDPELDLDFVPEKARRHVIRNAISNSFAFGGHNATIVLRKYTAQD
ncbi:MAG TPA: beta-ketoacyl-[acyl-carrier-protein] synthase II, partial [Spirochaetota bacterium]|nr:beta-ketoacyl-[acyl-carrier-protein] synthase II [Spirochaetota bacterium]